MDLEEGIRHRVIILDNPKCLAIGLRVMVDGQHSSAQYTWTVLRATTGARRIVSGVALWLASGATVQWNNLSPTKFRVIVMAGRETLLDGEETFSAEEWDGIKALSRQGCSLGALDDDCRIDTEWGLILIPQTNITWRSSE